MSKGKKNVDLSALSTEQKAAYFVRKLASYMGFAAKAGKIASGTNTCIFTMAKGKARLLIIADDMAENSKEKLPLEEQIEILQKKLEDAEMRATEKGIALIEMTAGRNALYQSLQDTQMRLAEVTGQYENDVQVYKNELEVCMKEKRQLQEQYDSIFIKAKRYDELQESVIKIKMKAEMIQTKK